jgi:LPS export ABC transporter protein LptC
MVRKEKIQLIRILSLPFYFVSGLFLFLLLFYTGCRNDRDNAVIQAHSTSFPVMSAKNIEVVFSDSGHVQAKLYSILLDRYEGNQPYLEFPKGFRMEIYDSAFRVETTIRANWGKRLENSRIMEAKGNVVVRNELRDQQLNTEQLFWDENRRRIYSTGRVKITTPDKVLFGQGLESNESFTRYVIIRPTGQMMVKKDSI